GEEERRVPDGKVARGEPEQQEAAEEADLEPARVLGQAHGGLERAAGAPDLRRVCSSGAPMTPSQWPTLQIPGWQETRATLLMLTQIVGKTRMALAPFQNHWWQVPLYLSARGLTTSAVPWREHTLEIEFDFIRHQLELRSSLGQSASIPLV